MQQAQLISFAAHTGAESTKAGSNISTGDKDSYKLLYCRYKLLLEELLKHTRYTHMDYSKLTGDYTPSS